jgi:hypothetical protein
MFEKVIIQPYLLIYTSLSRYVTIMDVFVQPDINCSKLTSLYPRLFISLETVAKQFVLKPEE